MERLPWCGHRRQAHGGLPACFQSERSCWKKSSVQVQHGAERFNQRFERIRLVACDGPGQVAAANELDRELHAGLEKAGFRLSDGPNGQGVLGLLYGENTTGYYYNAGASQLIADGSIKLRHGSVTELSASGVSLDSGDVIEADMVVFATGYRGVPTALRYILGADTAENSAQWLR